MKKLKEIMLVSIIITAFLAIFLTNHFSSNFKEGWFSIDPESTLKYDKMNAEKLGVGDSVFTLGGWKKINSIEYIDGEIQTYNLKTIEGTNVFFADSVLAHNKGGGSSLAVGTGEISLSPNEVQACQKVVYTNPLTGLAITEYDFPSHIRCSNWSNCTMAGSELLVRKESFLKLMFGKIKDFFINMFRFFFPDSTKLCGTIITSDYDECVKECKNTILDIQEAKWDQIEVSSSSLLENYNSYLKAYWNMNEDKGNRKDSFGDNDLKSNMVGTGEGISGSAVTFEDDYGGYSLKTSQSTKLKTNGNFAVSLWLNIDGYSNADHSSIIRDLGDSVLNGWDFGLTNVLGGGYYFNARSKEAQITSAELVPKGWHNVVLISDNNEVFDNQNNGDKIGMIYVYINGVEKSSQRVNYQGNPSYFNVGNGLIDFSLGRGTLNGKIDETGFWNEIDFKDYNERNNFAKELYNRGKGFFYNNKKWVLADDSSFCLAGCQNKSQVNKTRDVYCKSAYTCINEKCIEDKCANGKKNFGESGIDCGGNCRNCLSLDDGGYRVFLDNNNFVSLNLKLGELASINYSEHNINKSVLIIKKISYTDKQKIMLGSYNSQGILLSSKPDGKINLLFEDKNKSDMILSLGDTIYLSSSSNISIRKRACSIVSGCLVYNCSIDLQACLNFMKDRHLELPNMTISCDKDPCDKNDSFCKKRGYNCGQWETCEETISCGSCNDTQQCYQGICVCNENWTCGEWGECHNLFRNRTCFDSSTCNSAALKPAESEICSEIEPQQEIIQDLFLSPEDCESDVRCSDWSECEINPVFQDLISGVNEINGRKSRDCTDENNCVSPIKEYASCLVKLDISISKETFCNEDYIAIHNKETGELVSRIKDKKTDEKPSLNIDFITGMAVCDYCFNGVKDGDETAIDCGGSCRKCDSSDEIVSSPEEEKGFIEKNFLIIINIILIIIIISLFFIIFLVNKNNRDDEIDFLIREGDKFIKLRDGKDAEGVYLVMKDRYEKKYLGDKSVFERIVGFYNRLRNLLGSFR